MQEKFECSTFKCKKNLLHGGAYCILYWLRRKMKCYTHFKLLIYYGMNLITHTNPVLTWRRSARPPWSPLAPTRRWSWEGWAVSLGNKRGPWGRLQYRWPLQQQGTCSAHEPFRKWRWKSKTNTGKNDIWSKHTAVVKFNATHITQRCRGDRKLT